MRLKSNLQYRRVVQRLRDRPATRGEDRKVRNTPAQSKTSVSFRCSARATGDDSPVLVGDEGASSSFIPLRFFRPHLTTVSDALRPATSARARALAQGLESGNRRRERGGRRGEFSLLHFASSSPVLRHRVLRNREQTSTASPQRQPPQASPRGGSTQGQETRGERLRPSFPWRWRGEGRRSEERKKTEL